MELLEHCMPWLRSNSILSPCQNKCTYRRIIENSNNICISKYVYYESILHDQYNGVIGNLFVEKKSYIINNKRSPI
jgi:hypothetical protein